MRYGYRVHKLELARGLRGRRLLEPKTCTNTKELEDVKKGLSEAQPKVDYLELLRTQLDTLKQTPDAQTDIPKLIAVADGADEFVPGDDPGTPRLVVNDFKVVGRRVMIDVEYGHLGWHRRAVGSQKAVVSNLNGQSPMQDYRLAVLVPDNGTTGLIASETISGGHALPMLVAWLNQLSREAEGDDGMVRLMAHPLTDLERVFALLESDAGAEIELVRVASTAGTTDGAHASGRITLKEQVVPGTKRESIKRLLRTWYENNFKFDAAEHKNQVAALAEVISPQAAALEFTDGVIRLDPLDSKKLSVRPSKLGELYSYEISESRPSPTAWESAVQTRLAEIAQESELSVSWS